MAVIDLLLKNKDNIINVNAQEIRTNGSLDSVLFWGWFGFFIEYD